MINHVMSYTMGDSYTASIAINHIIDTLNRLEHQTTVNAVRLQNLETAHREDTTQKEHYQPLMEKVRLTRRRNKV